MRIGVDLGGTKIEIIALADDGAVLLRRRIATPAGDYEATLDAVAGLVASAEAELGRRGTIGIGTPGAISRATGTIKNANSTMLNGKPLEHDLRARLGRPIRLANDANCFALSEASDGAGAGARVVFGVILGTGTGGGIVVDGHVILGRDAIAGEWGHNPLPWARDDERPGLPCYCGKLGCLETFLSGPGLAKHFAARTGRTASAPEIVAAAAAGDGDAEEELARYADRLARGLAHVVNILDPDAIVLGGGLSNIAGLYSAVPRLMQGYVFSDAFDTPLRAALHSDSSGVRGAAWLWPVTGVTDE
jgi:fructokinase